MAFDFDGTIGKFVSSESAPATAAPLTMSCIVNPRTTTNVDYFIFNLGNRTANTAFLLYSSNQNISFWQNAQANLGGFVLGFQQVTGITSSETSRFVFRNELKSSENTQAVAPPGINAMGIGAKYYNNGNGDVALNGLLAEVAVWSVALTDDEVRSLSKGFKATRVRPQSLVFYAPLLRNLQDLRQARALINNNGVSVADHPRVY